jgi:cyclopropane fatty-acyl-phospholipid synthase-like methyltransferase
MSSIKILHSMLGAPQIYSFAMRMIGGQKARKVHAEQYISAKPGDRVLDVGCGPADILNFLPDIHYVGIDMESSYIASAKEKFRNRGSFIIGDVAAIDPSSFEPFDIILANGLLHHLNDDQVFRLLESCKKLLKPNGRMITLDGCYTEKQHIFDRWMLDNDRGDFVRREHEYRALATRVFASVTLHKRTDLLRIPYTILLMELSHSTKKMTPDHRIAISCETAVSNAAAPR